MMSILENKSGSWNEVSYFKQGGRLAPRNFIITRLNIFSAVIKCFCMFLYRLSHDCRLVLTAQCRYSSGNSVNLLSRTIAWWRPAACSWNITINIKVTIVRHMIKLNYPQWLISFRTIKFWLCEILLNNSKCLTKAWYMDPWPLKPTHHENWIDW